MGSIKTWGVFTSLCKVNHSSVNMILCVILAFTIAVANGHSEVYYNREYADQHHYEPVGMDEFVNDDVDCHQVEKVIYKDQCIPYFVKTCYVHHEANCEKVYDKDCKAEIEEYEDHECFDVTEKDKQCVEVESVECYDKPITITDQKCIYSVDFKYHKNGKKCDMIPTKECFDKPRTVTERVCKPKKREQCEKFLNEHAHPEAEEKCRKVPVKQCTLEKVQRPKKAKEYDYHKECKEVKREICKDVERKQLETECRELPRKVCKFEPKEKCDVQKEKHCFKEEVIVYEKVCLPGNHVY